jgi:hypothetical protein
MNYARLSWALIVVVALANLAIAQPPSLDVKASINLTSASDGFAGRLELLEDSRLTADLDKVLWESGGPEIALDGKDLRYRELTAVPLLHAALRLLDNHSRVIQEMTLEREQARIRTEQLGSGHRTILVTTDLSAGFGSYSGPVTELLDVSRGKIVVVSARDSQSGKISPIYLPNTLKTAWKVAPATARSGASKDILEVACRPNADASRFYVTYTRYHWNGTGWIAFSLETQGYWEDDGKFPSAERFPRGHTALLK